MFKHHCYAPPTACSQLKELESLPLCDSDDGSNVAVYDDTLILPYQRFRGGGGGVQTRDMHWLAGMQAIEGGDGGGFDFYCKGGYAPTVPIASSQEEVIFAGILHYEHFGNFMRDSLVRLWYVSSHPQDLRRLAYIHFPMPGGAPEPLPFVWEFLSRHGIDRERVLIVEQPTCFRRIIVPRQAVFPAEKYVSGLFELSFNPIRDSLPPGPHRRIYLSRRRYDKHDLFGEKYFEDYYRSRGHKIICMEQLPLGEQIAIISGAEEVVCTWGTLALWSQFARTGSRWTYLLRTYWSNTCAVDGFPLHQILLCQARQLDYTFVDTALSLLPMAHDVHGACLIGPSSHFQEFAHTEHGVDLHYDLFAALNSGRLPVGAWLAHYLRQLSTYPRTFQLCIGKDYRLDWLVNLYQGYDPQACQQLWRCMLNLPSQLAGRRFTLTINGQDAGTIILASDGRIHGQHQGDLKWWTCHTQNLYLLNEQGLTVIEVSIRAMRGVLRSNVAVCCELSEMSPSGKQRFSQNSDYAVGTVSTVIPAQPADNAIEALATRARALLGGADPAATEELHVLDLESLIMRLYRVQHKLDPVMLRRLCNDCLNAACLKEDSAALAAARVLSGPES